MDNKKQEEFVKKHLKIIGKTVEEQLPKGFGYVLLSFKFNEKDGLMMYCSNSNREDVIKAMKEFIEKTENTYGNDTNKY